jgi:outer membrane usher protein FimD/PapC
MEQELVILKVVINKDDRGEFFLIMSEDRDIWIKREDLNRLGLKRGVGRDIRHEGETYVSLMSVSDLTFEINEEEVSLVITADPYLFEIQEAEISFKRPYNVSFASGPAAFLNYSVIYDDIADNSFFNLAGELGFSIEDYFARSTFTYARTDGINRFTRLMTNITVNDRENLRTAILGDFAASSGILGSGAILGGFNLSKNYSIDPHFLKFPPLNLAGTLDTPSEVTVYLDGLPVRQENLSTGRFIYNDVPATVGRGNARIIIRDARENVRTLTIPFYYSNRLLKRGLHEYSYSIGFSREKTGFRSFSYGEPLFLSFHNYGFLESFTAGYTAEASKDVINIGPSVSFLIPYIGIVETAFALSNYRGQSGISGFLGYSFQARNFNVKMAVRSNSKKYANLFLKPWDDKSRLLFSGSVGFGGKRMGFISAEYTHSDMFNSPALSRVSVSYNKTLSRQATLFATASQINDGETKNEILVGLHIYFGKDISGHVEYFNHDGSDRKKASIQKSVPTGTGFGYKVSAESSPHNDFVEGHVQYQSRMGIYEAGYSNRFKDGGYGISVSGGIGYIDKSFFLSRPLRDSFAKVKVADLDNVRVYNNGNETGRTNQKGEFIVPDLRSFQDNRISIESRDIPLNYSIQTLSKYISPSFRSGALVEFDVKRTQGIMGTLYISREDREVPAELVEIHLILDDRTVEGFVGRDGEFYIEDITPGMHPAHIFYKGKKCRFDLAIPVSDETVVDLGKITCEMEK